MDQLNRGRVSHSNGDKTSHGHERRRRLRRIGAVAAIGLTPVIALAWAGCGGDDDPVAAGASYVDPGGTWGAEVTVAVKGRGRVTSVSPGVNCPSDCFSKYIFTGNGADGATGGITLKAEVTPGSRFTGWTFDTRPLGARGRGPENCNPVLRNATSPAVDMMALEITLPFGETAGVPPAGQEGSCSGQTTVPLVYNVTANFATDPPPPEAGPDGEADGGTLETVFNPASSGGSAQDVGLRQDGYLFWRFRNSSGYEGIAYGSPSGGLSQTPQIAVSPTSSVTTSSPFEVDAYGVIYQNSLGIFVIPYGRTSPTALMGTVATCNALAVDASYHAYCRTSSTILQWQYTGGGQYSAVPVTLYNGLSFGNDLVAESGQLYFTDSSTIFTAPIGQPDAGPITTVVNGISAANTSNLEAYGPGLIWLRSSGNVYATSSRSSSASLSDTTVPPTSSNRYFARDNSSSSYFWVASTSSIYRAYYQGGSSTQQFRADLSITGMAVDGQYVYVSQNDGTIRRIGRSGL